jgi:chromate transporter
MTVARQADKSLWFALHVFFARVDAVRWGPLRLWLPDVTTLDVKAVAFASLAALLLLRFHSGIALTLASAAAVAVAWSLWLG